MSGLSKPPNGLGGPPASCRNETRRLYWPLEGPGCARSPDGVRGERIRTMDTTGGESLPSGRELGAGRFPIPGQELIELLYLVIVDAGERVRQALRPSRSCQLGRTSAPTIPQLVHTIRGPKLGSCTSSDQQSATSTAPSWQSQQVTASERTRQARMLASVIGAPR